MFAVCAARAYLRRGMAARFVTTTVVALLIATLALLCLGGVGRAALPNDESTEYAMEIHGRESPARITSACAPRSLPAAART